MNQIPRFDWLPEEQDGAILPARDCLFCFCNDISPKSERVHERCQNIFRDRIKIFATSRDGWILSLFFLSFLFYLFIYFFVGVFMVLDLSRSIETQKENLANIQPS